MEEAVSLEDATREISVLLHNVQAGRRYVVTSQGQPVARLLPIADTTSAKSTMRGTLLSRLDRQPVVSIERWTREELYEREP